MVKDIHKKEIKQTISRLMWKRYTERDWDEGSIERQLRPKYHLEEESEEC
jgi:hypothetical protein